MVGWYPLQPTLTRTQTPMVKENSLCRKTNKNYQQKNPMYFERLEAWMQPMPWWGNCIRMNTYHRKKRSPGFLYIFNIISFGNFKDYHDSLPSISFCDLILSMLCNKKIKQQINKIIQMWFYKRIGLIVNRYSWRQLCLLWLESNALSM